MSPAGPKSCLYSFSFEKKCLPINTLFCFKTEILCLGILSLIVLLFATSVVDGSLLDTKKPADTKKVRHGNNF